MAYDEYSSKNRKEINTSSYNNNVQGPIVIRTLRFSSSPLPVRLLNYRKNFKFSNY